jgi:hypothetical protein
MFLLSVVLLLGAPAQGVPDHHLRGVVVTPRNEPVEGATVVLLTRQGEVRTFTNMAGEFTLSSAEAPVVLRVEGRTIRTTERLLENGSAGDDLVIVVEFLVPPVHETIVISASAVDPAIDRRNEAVYRQTLFSRDDQIFHMLDAGISAGQHEGGGKSLEIRRFGFNLDHGGVNGGLRVQVDNLQQNQGTQGHGQGYLGGLKGLIPELVEEVEIHNGPFHAAYGDFSGLGVVHIRRHEALPHLLTLRLHGGHFGNQRGLLGWSPRFKSGDALLAYEGAHLDGPFERPLHYRRDNVFASVVRRGDAGQSIGFKSSLSRNNFFSSGQLPQDEVSAGRLSRFGFLDPDNGGRARAGMLAFFYQKERGTGELLKVDALVARTLFDLYSNFTFFLNDPVRGDELQQHDSRLEEGVNAQYLAPYRLAGRPALLVAGANFHASQNRVGLFHTAGRVPVSLGTDARARVSDIAGYVQQGVDLAAGRLHLEAGLRYDYFRFAVDDLLQATASGAQGQGRWQPKFSVAYSPAARLPLTLHFNYGRGIASQDARGVVRQPDGPRVSTTNFSQAGLALRARRASVLANFFLIDQSATQVYVPDDGSIDLAGPSRSHGFEAKASAQLSRKLAFNGGFTRVGNAFFRGTQPRTYLDRAPHLVSYAALTFSNGRGFSASARFRHNSGYRLDGTDAGIRASGSDVLDISMTKALSRGLELSMAIDNATNKHYLETQNYFASRVSPAAPVVERIHATPGFPLGLTAGLTYRFGAK